MDEIYLIVALEEGHYIGIDNAFSTKSQAIDYAQNKMGYMIANEDEFSHYGIIDYVDPDHSKFRIAIEKVTITNKEN